MNTEGTVIQFENTEQEALLALKLSFKKCSPENLRAKPKETLLAWKIIENNMSPIRNFSLTSTGKQVDKIMLFRGI